MAVRKETKTSERRYFEGVGRRKTAVARVRFYPVSDRGNDSFIINGKDYKKHFSSLRYEKAARAPMKLLHDRRGKVEVKVSGGGVMAQSEAITLGLTRALVKFEPDLKKEMRAFGFLTRDPRMVERKKYGLKKARRAPQWRKR